MVLRVHGCSRVLVLGAALKSTSMYWVRYP